MQRMSTNRDSIELVPPRTATPDRYRWVILGILWFVFMIAFMLRLSIGPLGPFLRQDLSLSGAQVGFLVSASAIGLMAALVPAGILVDRIKIRWIILAGSAITGISLVAAFGATGFTRLALCMACAGVGMGCLYPVNTKALMFWFPPNERATAMGLIQTATNIGGVSSAVILPYIAVALGWHYGFLIFGIAAVFFGVLASFLYRNPPDNNQTGRTKPGKSGQQKNNKQVKI